MNKPWGLEKRSASEWEDLYWQSIKRYPEMNAKVRDLEEDLALALQALRELRQYITTLDHFSSRYFNTVGMTIYYDFHALRDKLVRQRQLIDTLKDNYRHAVLQLAAQRKEFDERPKEERRYIALSASKYL